jgi:hypothetical protein
MMRVGIYIFAAVLLCPGLVFAQPTGPTQPATGPAGTEYPHAGMSVKGPYWATGPGRDDNYLYYMYEPAFPAPASAPVMLFLHGWLAYEPAIYASWIQHTVKKGHVVVWVRYDATLSFPVRFPDKAIITWKDALRRLTLEPGHVRPATDGGRVLNAIAGHSIGGYMAAIIAARAADPGNDIPAPGAVIAMEPGGLNVMRREDLTQIAPSTKLVLVVGEDDIAVADEAALAIWEGTPQIPNANRDYLLVQTDQYGSPPLIADHNFPMNIGRESTIDGLDFYATYKLTVGALNCAFKNLDCEYALGNGSFEQTQMGRWSDGVDVKPMIWIPNPLAAARAGAAATFGGRQSR